MAQLAAPDGPRVLRESDVDLADFMRSFVDDAIATVVTGTETDEGIVRRWLADRLITPSGRRAVLLVDNEQTTGLPDAVLDAMEDARLVQVEQRNRSRYAELTHDSMLTAVQASNTAWFSARGQSRRRYLAGSLLALVLLVVAFALLRNPPEETLLKEARGEVAESPIEIALPRTQPGRVATVQIRLTGQLTDVAMLRVIARGDGTNNEEEVIKQTVPSGPAGDVKTTIGLVVDTSRLASEKLVVEPGDASYLSYVVSVYSAPVILEGKSDHSEISSAFAAVKLVPGRPLFLQVDSGTELRAVLGARVLYKDSNRAVLEAPGERDLCGALDGRNLR
jgi:hypothetical protein